MKCSTPAKALIAVAVLGMVFCLVILIVCSSEWPAPEFFFSMMFLFYFYLLFDMVSRGFLQLWIEVCYKWIPISGTVKHLSTVTFCNKTTYWAHVTYQMVAEKEADSLAEDDETEEPNSSTFSEEDCGMEEDARPASAHDTGAPGVFFWKKMQIPRETNEELCQTDYIMTRQPFPMQVPLNRPQDAERRVAEGPSSLDSNLAPLLMFQLYLTVNMTILGYFGVIFPLQQVFHIMKNDDDDANDDTDASPWYIVAVYFALPMFFLVGCLAAIREQTGPVFGIVSSEDEEDADAVALTAITRTKQMKNLRGGGEDDSVEKMSTTTTTTTSTITSAETENDVADVDLWC